MQSSTLRALPQASANRTRAFRLPGMVPLSTGEFLRRRLDELIGLVQILVAAAMVAALVTYFPGDPSWNSAMPSQWLHRIHNVMGMVGAFFADLFIQTLGLAAYLLPISIAVWGLRLLRHRQPTALWLRLIYLFSALLFASATLAPLAPFAQWPTTASMGGSIGRQLLRFGADGLAAAPGRIGTWAAWAGATTLAIVLLSATFGIGWRAWRRAFLIVARAAGWAGAGFALLRGRDRREPVLPQSLKADPVKPIVRIMPEPASVPVATGKAGVKAPRTPPTIRKGESDKARQAELNLPAPPVPTDHILPPLELLRPAPPEARSPELTDDFMRQNAEMLSSVLSDFGVKGEMVNIRPGPVVTLYELEPAPGTKSSRVIGLADDIARSMSAVAVRVAVVPGRNVMGIELPNQRREIVYMRGVLESDSYVNTTAKLPLVLGKDIGGKPVIADLARMPHLLVAGTTGSGKSVAINTMILSLLYRLPPERCRFIMVDPKMLELSVYEGIPHLLAPVVTEPKKAVVALKWTVREMEDRYRAMSKLGVRNVEGFNQRLKEARQNGELLSRKVQTGFDADTGKPVFEDQPIDLKELPYIVVVVDEFADLMLVAGKDIEGAIQRLAQMARAAGIHLIMATQRPSVDVITGTIKANFPTRISFQVTSKIDSRTILGESGAEQLLGQGDMLYMAAGGRVTRVHGPFVRDQEVEKVVAFLKTQGEPDYIDEVTEDDGLEEMGASGGEESEGGGSGDSLYDQAVALVAREGKASTSFVQRHLRIGYNSAARLIERMEKEGVVSPANHVGKREVLVGNHAE
jgi:S-DNA-T family DNA segregation ATPase FtsK/SpoIIIE